MQFFRKEQRETFQAQLHRVIHQDDDDNDGEEKENETENENLQGEEIKILPFSKYILRPHPSLHKLALSNSFTPLLQLSHFFSTSNTPMVASLRKQIADETGLSDILTEILRTWYSPTAREILFFSKFITIQSILYSGTTGIASKLINRQFIGIEREKEYFDICEERLSVSREELVKFFKMEKDTQTKLDL